MKHLGHPFDDALFAGMAASAGIARGDLPTEYDPGFDWGNDSLETSVPGLPRFAFIVGDDGWFGRMAIHHDRFTYRRLASDAARIELPFLLSETQAAVLPGGPCSRILDAPGISDWIVTSIARDPDDPDGTVMDIAPQGSLCQAA